MTSATRLAIGALYLAGSGMLLPGFLWIVPTGVKKIPVSFNHTTHRPDRLKCCAPVYDPQIYAQGVHILIAGISIVLIAAVADLFLVHCRGGRGTKGTAMTPMLPDAQPPPLPPLCVRLISPICQVLGAAFILAGCVVFLPQYSLPGPTTPPVKIWGSLAPDVGNFCFEVASALYFVGALIALGGVGAAARAARRAGKPALALCVTACAFALFLATSVLFFVNGRMPKERAVEAGQLRLAAAACLLSAVVLLFAVELRDVRAGSRPTSPAAMVGTVNSAVDAEPAVAAPPLRAATLVDAAGQAQGPRRYIVVD